MDDVLWRHTERAGLAVVAVPVTAEEWAAPANPLLRRAAAEAVQLGMSAGIARAREELFAAHLLATTQFAAQSVALAHRGMLAAADAALEALDRVPPADPAALIGMFLKQVVRERGLDPEAGRLAARAAQPRRAGRRRRRRAPAGGAARDRRRHRRDRRRGRLAHALRVRHDRPRVAPRPPPPGAAEPATAETPSGRPR